MGVRAQAADPWGILSAVLLGGMAGAVTAAVGPAALLAVPVGLAVGGAVYGVRVGLGLLTDRGDPATRPSPPDARVRELPEPPRGSPAAQWLRRAEEAVATLRHQVESPRDPVLRSQIGDVDDQAAAVLTDLRRFAGEVTLIEQAAGRIDMPRLVHEAGAVRQALRGVPPGPLRDERERALRALDDQLNVGRRLASARETLLARMQSAALGLDGLVARVAELLALHATTDAGSLTAMRVAELASDLEGMRAGLAEAEQVSHSALSGGASSDGPAVGSPNSAG